jgi:hypothetical protein
MSNEIIEHDTQAQHVLVAQRAAGAVAAVTPMDLLRHAMDSGADLDRLEKLMDLQERWEANEARKAFANAMADFKLNPPKVFKDKDVSYGEGRSKTEYSHATLGNATDIIIAALAKHGFSHRWVTTQRDNLVIVECVLTHRLGHSQSNLLQSAPDQSGGKNAIQAIVSARSYLERHSLFDATGLAPLDAEDDDGAGAAALDTALADKWCGDAARATTLGALEIVWNHGAAAIKESGTDFDMNDFKVAVNARKAQLLPKPEANKSSRLRDIVGAGQAEQPAAAAE